MVEVVAAVVVVVSLTVVVFLVVVEVVLGLGDMLTVVRTVPASLLASQENWEVSVTVTVRRFWWEVRRIPSLYQLVTAGGWPGLARRQERRTLSPTEILSRLGWLSITGGEGGPEYYAVSGSD